MGQDNQRLSAGLISSLGAFLVIGLAGLIMNLIIAFYKGSDALGIFNQALALYIVISQFCVFGIHNSALTHIARRSARGAMFLLSAFALVGVISISIAGLSLLLMPAMGWVFGSPEVAQSWLYLVPALVLFSLNKLALGLLNGMSRIVSYNALASLRYIVAVGVIWWLCLTDGAVADLTLGLLFGELAVAFLAIPYTFVVLRGVRKETRPARPGRTLQMLLLWTRRHLGFGAKSFLGNSIIELNSRADVLMLGIFLDDSAVGYYVMASTLAEGFAQLPILLRLNINPLLARAHQKGRLQQAITDLARLRIWFLALMSLGAITLVGGFYGFLHLEVLEDDFIKSLPVLAILGISIAATARQMPFNQMLMVCNRPGLNTYLYLGVLILNIAFNALLIPVFGIIGAACATAISILFFGAAIHLFAHRMLGVRL